MGYIDAGKKGGARCVAGGDRQGKVGFFVQPTVFADVKDDMKIAKEEVRSDTILDILLKLCHKCCAGWASRPPFLVGCTSWGPRGNNQLKKGQIKCGRQSTIGYGLR